MEKLADQVISEFLNIFLYLNLNKYRKMLTGQIHSSFIEQYFGGAFDVVMKCAEAPDETPTTSKENFLQLSCFISQEVKYMHSGLRSVI